jgi:hypothetical protein
MSRRVCRVEGQLPLLFELEVKPIVEEPEAVAAPVVVEETAPPVEPVPPPQPKQRKHKIKVPFTHPTPSVTFHKSGRFILIKPNDPVAAMHWDDVKERAFVDSMRSTKYFDNDAADIGEVLREEVRRIDCWRHLGSDLEQHPFSRILKTYGVTTFISPTLRNFLKKEQRKQERENTPFPVPPIETDVKLFDRCSEGTLLRCVKDFTAPNGTAPLFSKDKRYMVVSTGGEGKDHVVLSTEPIVSNTKLTLVGTGKRHEWTTFDPEMEEWFSDSEETETGEDITQKYPGLVAQMEAKLKKLALPLYEHVERDVVLMALKRGGINAYPMRMAKTSFAITWAKLCGSKKVAFIGPRNARIFTVKELKRLGFKENIDFVVVDEIEDLEKPATFYLLTYTWLRKGEDPTYKSRNSWENFLRPSERQVKQKDENGVSQNVSQKLYNLCPHCKERLQRLVRVDAENADGSVVIIREKSATGLSTVNVYYKWTDSRGYRCTNKECSYVTDNRYKQGVAWSARKLTKHKGGYIDFSLAAHVNCPDVRVKGRQCPTCKQTDGVWIPAIYKRLKKDFTAVIPDEIHSCKDDATATAIATFNLRARRRLGLTGTLISNSPLDTYWPLHWTLGAPAHRFPYFHQEGEKEFDERFCDAVSLEKPAGEEVDEKTGAKTQLTKLVRKRIPFLKNPPDFWRFMVDKVVRRTYQDPLFQKTLLANNRTMPKTEIIKYPCPMDGDQARIMLASIKDFKGQYEKMQAEAAKKGNEVNSALVISQMSTLRIVATCPEMLNETFKTKVYKGKPGGGKMAYIRNIVEQKVAKGEKVLILSDFLAMQRTCENELREFNPIRFNTGWDDDARREAFEAFQYGKDAKVFVAGTRAIREGVDLSAADTVICCDLLWSPAFQTQAWSRIMAPTDRPRTCEVYLMVSSNSLDEHIYGVFYSKMVAAEQAMDRKVLNRRAQEFDVKWFVERVLEEEAAITTYLERSADEGESSSMMTVQPLNTEELEEREV